MIQREFIKAWSVEYPWRLPEMAFNPREAWASVKARLVDFLGGTVQQVK